MARRRARRFPRTGARRAPHRLPLPARAHATQARVVRSRATETAGCAQLHPLSQPTQVSRSVQRAGGRASVHAERDGAPSRAFRPPASPPALQQRGSRATAVSARPASLPLRIRLLIPPQIPPPPPPPPLLLWRTQKDFLPASLAERIDGRSERASIAGGAGQRKGGGGGGGAGGGGGIGSSGLGLVRNSVCRFHRECARVCGYR